MVRIARERVADLFAQAEQESREGHGELADRYVALARRIGMRYNVRLPPEYRERYCRSCSGYWVEGRTVRTRLRAGRRVRVCLRCGRVRRAPLKAVRAGRPGGADEGRTVFPRDQEVLADAVPGADEESSPDDETEEG
jgi:ribonuclease P protein subunit RPR2